MEDEVKELSRPILNVKRKPKNRKTKNILVFDETARKEYLTGFRKRKNERRKKAQEENVKKIKLQKQAVKQQMREIIQKSDRYRVPEMERLCQEDSTVIDLPEHTVTITDMSEMDLSGSSRVEQISEPNVDDTEIRKKKKKQLMHKLADIGNTSSSKRRRTKRPKKFKGQSKDMAHGGGKKRHKLVSKKNRHKVKRLQM